MSGHGRPPQALYECVPHSFLLLGNSLLFPMPPKVGSFPNLFCYDLLLLLVRGMGGVKLLKNHSKPKHSL
jgi:hypothetical protein